MKTADNTAPRYNKDGIEIHGTEGFAGMRAAGKLAAEVLDYITPFVVPGALTEDLDRLCHEYIEKHGAIPAPLGYKGFPKATCISINEVVCHGIPGQAKKKILDGNIANIDVTVILDGWHGDTSRMFCVGDVKLKDRRLVDITYDAMMAGIEQVKPGNSLDDVARAIQTVAEAAHFSVVRDFCGHGLGRKFHTAPSVLHYVPGEDDIPQEHRKKIILEPGMFFTIEPMINAGGWATKMKDDGWTAVTRDLKWSAQFEHSLGVTETGYEIFTLSPKGHTKPPYGG